MACLQCLNFVAGALAKHLDDKSSVKSKVFYPNAWLMPSWQGQNLLLSWKTRLSLLLPKSRDMGLNDI